MKNSLRLKAGALLTTAFGVILVSGITGGVTLPQIFLRGSRRGLWRLNLQQT